MSTEPLQKYFDCLSFFASGSFERVDKSTEIDLALVDALLEQECLTGVKSSSYDGLSFLNMSITPHGAVVLAEWSTLLRNNSFKGQLLNTAGRLVWLFAGMLITVFGSLLFKISG